jgi:prepilin-type N-terminal cleavage/methylation domain-containing protein
MYFNYAFAPMALVMRNARARPALRGFTLTELAIVLGIMGIILGAIWGAASHVYANNKNTAAIQEIVTISGGMKGAFTKGTFGSGYQNLAGYAINAGIVPGQFIGSCTGTPWGAGWGGTAGCAITPWGQGNGGTPIQIIMATQSGWGGAPVSPSAYEININPLTPAQCAAFLPALIQQAAGSGLVWVYADNVGSTTVTSTTPITTFQNCSGDVILQFAL